MKFYDWFGKEYDHPEIDDAPLRHSVKALIVYENSVLLVKPKYHELWELPGGGVDSDEDNKSALIREIYEESGYKAKIIDNEPFHTTDKKGFFIPDRDVYCISIVMTYFGELINLEQKTEHIDFDREIMDIKFFDLDKLPKEIHYISKQSIEIGLKLKGLEFKYE